MQSLPIHLEVQDSLQVTDRYGLRFFFFFFRFFFLGLRPQHMEAPRLGVELELPAYTTATAVPDPSCICDLHHSSQQCQILNPLSKAKDRTRNMVPSWICFRCTTMGTPHPFL